MLIRLRSNSCMSNTSFHKRAFGGQKYWWLRSVDTGDFVYLGEKYRGDRKLDIEIDLQSGRYLLGTGPKHKFGIRQYFELTKEGVFK